MASSMEGLSYWTESDFVNLLHVGKRVWDHFSEKEGHQIKDIACKDITAQVALQLLIFTV